MEFVSLLLSIVAAIAAAIVAMILATGVKVSRVKLKSMRTRVLELTRVPPKVRAVFDGGRRWLLPRGFRYAYSGAMTPLIAPKGNEERYSDVYEDGKGVFAVVALLEQPQHGQLLAIEFQTVFEDGTAIITCNRFRHNVLWQPPVWSIHDDFLPGLEQALERHRERVASSGKTIVTDPVRRGDYVRGVLEAYLDKLVEAGMAARDAHGETRLRYGPAVRFVWQMMRGNWRVGMVTPIPLQAQEAPGGEGAEAGIEADIQAYKARRAVSASMSSSGRWKLGVVSAIAFIAVGALLWDWTFALSILVVIAFHEGGHYAAMKWVGYRNLNVFFLPGLGGLATGEKQDATAAQKTLVYLAGPVPGIVIGTVGLVAAFGESTPWAADLSSLFTVMLILNVINLLPVTPLDGGRVLEVLLFVRWPTLRFAFAAASALALVAGGWALDERVMLIIGVLVALSLPHQWRVSRLALRVKRAPGLAFDERSAVHRVFGALSHPPFNRWSFEKRSTAADELISELRSPVPRAGMVVGGLAIYVACFVLPAVGAAAASPDIRGLVGALWEIRGMDEHFAEMRAEAEALEAAEPRRDWPAELTAARAQSQERYLAVLMEAVEAGHAPRNEQDPDKTLGEIRTIANTLPAGSAVRARALLLASDQAEESSEEQRRRALQALMNELTGADEESRHAKALVGTRLASFLEAPGERVALLVSSRDALKERVAAGDSTLAAAWYQLARERAEQGDAAGAEAEWRAILAWHGTATGPRKPGSLTADHAQLGYLSLLLQQSRWDDAERLVRPGVENALAAWDGKPWRMNVHLPKVTALFWIAAAREDAVQAAAWLKTWEAIVPSSLRERNSGLLVAKLALAELRRDAEAVTQARQRIAAMPGLPYLCKAGAMGMHDAAFAQRSQAMMARHGICKGQG